MVVASGARLRPQGHAAMSATPPGTRVRARWDWVGYTPAPPTAPAAVAAAPMATVIPPVVAAAAAQIRACRAIRAMEMVTPVVVPAVARSIPPDASSSAVVAVAVAPRTTFSRTRLVLALAVP